MTKICLHKALLKKGSVGRLALMFIIRTGCVGSAALESFEARLSSMVKRGTVTTQSHTITFFFPAGQWQGPLTAR